MSEAEASCQIELDSGKRVKVKAAHVLLRFDQPSPAQLLAEAQPLSQSIDLDLAWEFAPDAEFGFADLARDYFDAKGRVSRDYQPPAELVRRDGAAGVTPPGQTFSHPPQGIRANGKPKVASPADRFNAGRDVDMNTIEEILRRYGLAGLMAGGAAASARSSQDTQ